MGFCDGLILKDCEVCYEMNAAECENFVFYTDNLLEGELYYIQMLGIFDEVYTVPVEIGAGGSVEIDITDLPWNKYQGKFFFYLSTEMEYGTADVPVVISGTEWNCFVVELS